MKCDAGIHEKTCTFVVLSGDTTMFPSFGECVSTELTVSEYAGGLPVRHSETPTFQRESERSFSDHTETDAAHPEVKTVEISCAIL